MDCTDPPTPTHTPSIHPGTMSAARSTMATELVPISQSSQEIHSREPPTRWPIASRKSVIFAAPGRVRLQRQHEIYARAEGRRRAPLRASWHESSFRTRNGQLPFRGAQFNLLGAITSAERTVGGQRILRCYPTRDHGSTRDRPNICSPTTNTFNRARLGIEHVFSRAVPTDDQIQVESADHA